MLLQQLKTAYTRAMKLSILDMNAPLEWLTTYISPTVTGFGTAADEKVQSRKDYRKMLMDMRKQTTGQSYKAAIKTAYAPKFKGEATAVFNDEIEIKLGKGKTQVVIHLWMSTVFVYQKNQWLLSLFHGSMPDLNSSSEDTFHIQEAEKKVKALEEKVAERTAEIVEKNRELQIEAALERVRAIAMGMKKAEDMLLICKTISQQLEVLGVNEIRNVQTAIFYAEKGTYMNYEYYNKHQKTIVTEVAFTGKDVHRDQKKFAKSMLAGRDSLYIEQFSGAKLKQWYDYQKGTNQLADRYLLKAHSLNYYWFSLGEIALGISTYYPLIAAEQILFQRFRKVFDLSYRRYLDIEKAAAQAREAEIELALERVRARTMAMQHSNELRTIVAVIYEQLQHLGFKYGACGIVIMDETTGDMNWWMAGFKKKDYPKNYHIPYFNHPFYLRQLFSWKEGKEYEVMETSGNEKKKYDQYMFSRTGFANIEPEAKKIMTSFDKVTFSNANMKHGALSWGPNPIYDELGKILQRFAKVFEQTYTRFLDLQKAEEQAREAQIEAALERVRSRSLAMHKSDELGDVVIILLQKLNELGINPDGININIIDKTSKSIATWFTAPDVAKAFCFSIQYIDHPVINDAWDAFYAQKDGYQATYSKKIKDSYFKYLYTHTPFKQTPEDRKKMIMAAKIYHLSVALSNDAAISVHNYTDKKLTEKEYEILKRFSKVFQQSYTRFLDLQKAEAQAREAQIEAALEKVRSVAMSMHHSNELLNICEAIYEELIKLGMIALRNTMINIHNDAEETFLNYDYSAYAGRAVTKYGYNIHPIINHLVMQSRSAQDAFIDVAFEGAEFEAWRSFRKASGEKDDARLNKITHLHYYFYSIGIGSIGISTFESISDQNLALLKRFRNVFQLAYQRFTDLTAAEAQAREAQIETALERVRSRTMAMQNSSELAATVQVMFEECRKLQPTAADENFSRGFITTIDQKKKIFDLWITEVDGTRIDTRFNIEFDEPTTGIAIYKAWKQKKPFLVSDLKGETLDQWLNYLAATGFKVAPGIRGTRRVNTFIYYSNGFIGITSSLPIAEESIQILQRFAKVFDQTYTRFLDLQKAEAAAKEAIKQAALDRIRADIASMRTIEDLNRITPLIWNELTTLGVPFIRCGVFIMDEVQQQIHTFLSTPDGKSIAAFHLSFTESNNIISVVEHWHNKKVYSNHWGNTEFGELADSLVQQNAISSKDIYLQSIPSGGIHLNFLPYLQGMLYVGNEAPLTQEDILLLQSVADAFSTAYARYEDFNKLEAAKQVVEKTLEELKATQKQLVQSEKMASLGELTAGIAHEIQNPLNFVNNFSELNVELVQELRAKNEELGIKNDDINDLVSDIQSNSEKINHHGQRASAIVKGMLQHSRTSTGQKEPTDINALCDEYLRLAYHGLRAKDKTFNAKFETQFDETIPKVNIVPQDMGRVVLNIINNAFFAVKQRQDVGSSERLRPDDQTTRRSDESYTPLVIVSTKTLGNTIDITISDNGTGIPDSVKEKIFQPFFTTKPTGQGTGLGLSLAYDIVTKVHGGQLKVESEEGKGTRFIISLPL